MRWIALVFVICLVGCGRNEPKLPGPKQSELPPKFNYGDIVQPVGEQVCIVTNRGIDSDQGVWVYTVIHQNLVFRYKQTELSLIHRFDWSLHAVDWEKIDDISVGKAEIESNEEIPFQ